MSTSSTEALDAALSALADGRATPAEWQCIESAWAQDAGLRERWALWQCAGDGLRSAELAQWHRDPEALLSALHASMPVPAPPAARRRDWLAPLAVAAGFVAVAVGVTALRLAPLSPEPLAVASAPVRSQAPTQQTFAQTAVGHAGNIPPALGVQEAGLVLQAAPEALEWPAAWPPFGLTAPDAMPARPRP